MKKLIIPLLLLTLLSFKPKAPFEMIGACNSTVAQRQAWVATAVFSLIVNLQEYDIDYNYCNHPAWPNGDGCEETCVRITYWPKPSQPPSPATYLPHLLK